MLTTMSDIAGHTRKKEIRVPLSGVEPNTSAKLRARSFGTIPE